MRKNKIQAFSLILLLVSAIISCKTEQKPLKLAPVFTDNMVLQANKPVNIWGTATPGSKIIVTVRNQAKSIVADKSGKWLLTLNPETYGDAGGIIIKSSKEQVELNNVLFGEVWICSGQSNMEMPLVSNWSFVNNRSQEVADAAKYSEIRLFTVSKNIAFQPIDTISTQGWQICDTNSVKDFSASAYFFGRELYRELKVPIGLIHTSWGGTVAEAWTSKNSLLKTTDFAEEAAYISGLAGSRDSLQKKYEADMKILDVEIMEADPGFESEEAIFADIDLDDSDWMRIDLPKMWEETELGNYDGSTWFRKAINLSADEAKSEFTLCYGAPDDYDEAWVNGVKVGENKVWNELRKYKIPEGVIKEGKNIITLRVYDYTGGGGFMGVADDFKLILGTGKSIPIAQGWVAKKGFDFKDIKTRPVSLNDPNQPTVLFNAMINPLLSLTFQGAIWYQGESNAGRAFQYRELFKTMITDWRENFNNGDFPFYFVQLANYLPGNSQPVEDTWAELREAQTMALELPNTGMAVTIDIGDALDIHPGNKQDVGKRLALNALAKTYQKSVKYMGPLYQNHKIAGKKIELEFNFSEGLKTSDNKKLKGFSIAGNDSVFVWADAEIVGDKVIVSSIKVEKPIAVRYAWSANPECNLTNISGLPASPFRTDNWKGITE